MTDSTSPDARRTPQPPGAPGRIAALLEIGDIKAGRNELGEQDITDLREVLRQLADYENRIGWDTTCQQCATVLDRAVADHERAERAEAEADRLRNAWQQAWAERNSARSTIAAVRSLVAKWDGPTTVTERLLADAIIAITGGPVTADEDETSIEAMRAQLLATQVERLSAKWRGNANRAPFKDAAPTLNSGAPNSRLVESSVTDACLRQGAVDRVALAEPEPAGHFAKCERCTDPVFVHDDGSTDGGVDTLLGILCDRCLNEPEDETETEADQAATRIRAALADIAQGRKTTLIPADARIVLEDRDRLAGRVTVLERGPRCGATAPSVFENVTEPLGPCILDHGHAGMHQEGSPPGFPLHPGARWTEHNDPLAVAHARIRELEAELAETKADREMFRRTLEQDAAERVGRKP